MDDWLVLKTWLVLAWCVLLFILERLFASDKWPKRSSDLRSRLASNAGLWLINIPLSALIVLPITVWATTHGLGWRPLWWQGFSGLLLDILILDMAIYVWHVANHRIAFLWRFHEVHHLDEFLDVTSAVRFHFGEVILSAIVRGALIILLGLPLSSVLIFETLLLLGAVFHHSNLRIPISIEKPLSWLFVTPSIHWVHHHAREQHTNSNYATLLSIWDKLFGTFNSWQRQPGMSIGVVGQKDRSWPGLISRPFEKR